MEILPTPLVALELLSKAGCTPQVIEHCKAVSQLAVYFAKRAEAKGIGVDIDLVRSVEHGYKGSEMADSLGLPKSLTLIIERHVGSGIPADEASSLGLPKRDFVPKTLEEKLVSYADKLIEGKRRKSFDLTLDKFAKELGPNHSAITRLRKLHEELAEIVGEPQ
jgi:uncharacterized protein